MEKPKEKEGKILNIIAKIHKKGSILKRKESEKSELEVTTHVVLVHPDHSPRKIDTEIDFSFVHDLYALFYFHFLSMYQSSPRLT